MPKRSSKRKGKQDANTLAKLIVEEATEEVQPEDSGKDPAAVALGRKGGLKGGKARAASLSPKERSEIASKAAKARWNQKK